MTDSDAQNPGYFMYVYLCLERPEVDASLSLITKHPVHRGKVSSLNLELTDVSRVCSGDSRIPLVQGLQGDCPTYLAFTW